MDPLDPWRAARLLIEEHDERAAVMAMKRRQELRDEGDAAGAAVWNQVLHAVMALRSTRRRDGALDS